jgi:hypothetical protein
MGAPDGAVAGTVPSTWLEERMECTPAKRSRTPKVPATIKIVLDLVIADFHQYTPSLKAATKHWCPRQNGGKLGVETAGEFEGLKTGSAWSRTHDERPLAAWRPFWTPVELHRAHFKRGWWL